MDKKLIRATRHYPEAFRRKVIEEHLTTGASKMSLLRKYDIRFKGAIQRWMKQLGYAGIDQKVGYLPLTTIQLLSTKKNTTPYSEQSKDDRIKELEGLLQDEQLRSEAYQRMIAIAEKEFNIPIRKKPDTK